MKKSEYVRKEKGFALYSAKSFLFLTKWIGKLPALW